MQIKLSLNEQSIRDAINEIKQYQADLVIKCQQVCNSLADFGITVAKYQATQGELGHYITFTKKVQNIAGVETISMVASSGTITSVWQVAGTTREVDISPLLMTEFGSGWEAENPLDIKGVGQGTLNTYGHAKQKNGWYYQDIYGNWHHTRGFEPQQPMYLALLRMEDELFNVAGRVFKNG